MLSGEERDSSRDNVLFQNCFASYTLIQGYMRYLIVYSLNPLKVENYSTVDINMSTVDI